MAAHRGRLRRSSARVGVVGLVALALVAGQAVGGPAVAAGLRPKVVLDPDDNGAFGLHDGVTYEGYPHALSIAQAVRSALPSVCDSDVVITDRASSASPSGRAARAAQMQDADLSVTLSLNGFIGVEWGNEAEGGAGAFATNRPDNLAFGNDLAQQMHAFTGRPFEFVNEEETNGTVYPYPEFTGVPGTYAQFFMLFIDHTYDWVVIRDGRDLMVNAVVTALAKTLQAKGFKCLGNFPALPSAARLQQLRNLGYQRFLRYGAEPISMSTGNFSTAERIFTLPGVGRQVIDVTLNYNAQSGEDSPVGVGWQFAYGAFMQQYRDGAVIVNLPDGRGLLYVPNDSGGFTAPPGSFATLTQVDDTTFRWTTSTGTVMTFVQDRTGRGQLTATSDRQGNTETLTYDGTGVRFPKLASITDQAGQRVAVTTDDNGRITSFTRPDGAVWRLAYTAAGDLASVTSARGTVRRFNYDDRHRITSQVGQDGLTFLTNTYDDQSRVVHQTNSFGDQRTLVFDDSNRTTTYTDATGATTVYKWNEFGQVTDVVDAVGGSTLTAYNPDLLPTSETDPLSRTTLMGYDPSGQMSSRTDPAGNAVTATYNPPGDLISRTDRGGADGAARTFSFEVNSAGLQTTITNPDGTTRTRTYDSHGDLLTETDDAGAIIRYAYDVRGNAVRVTDPLGRVTTMTYDLANRLTSVADPAGRTTSYTYDANDNLIDTAFANASRERLAYDVNDQLVRKIDRRGGIITYDYDADLNIVAITLPNGGVIRNTFDSENRQTSVTDPEGHKTTYELDALGRRTAIVDANGHKSDTAYDAAGQVTSETDASGARLTYERDANGRPLKVTDQAGGITTNEWDKVGRLISVTDQRGHRTSYTYDFRDQIITTTDPVGGVATNAYDAAGRLVSRTDPAGATTTYAYDAAGQLIRVTDALGQVTTYDYDLAGNRIRTTDPNGHVTAVAYDSMNQPISRTNGAGETTTMERDAGGLLVAQTDSLGHSTRFAYDAIGNLIARTDALGRVTRLGYDLNRRQVAETAPDGIVTASSVDPVGNLLVVTRNARSGQSSSATVNVTTRYGYDPRNLLTTVTDANGGLTKYEYEARGLLLRKTDPLGKITAYSYDAAGNRISRLDPNGVTTYRYEPRNLLAQRAYPEGATDTFSYNAAGRQLTAANAAGTVRTTYDPLGRPVTVTDAAGKTLTYQYDAAGNRARLTLPDGRNLDYSYDAADRLTALNSPLGKLSIGYDAAGRPTMVRRPNGAHTTLAFDDAGELTRLVTATSSQQLASFVYSYDTAGNVASRTQRIGRTSTATTYIYDPLRRLTASDGGPLPSTYSYDAVGNRLTWSAPDDPATPKPSDPFTQTNEFNAAGQVVRSTKVRQNGSATFTDVTTNTYDSNGNRLLTATVAQAPGQSASTAYSYDLEGRLLTSAPAGDRANRGNGNDQRVNTRTYDALGRLVTDTRGTTTTTWTFEGLRPVLASDDRTTTLYLRDVAGELYGELSAVSDPSWYITDALDSVLASTDSKARLTGTTTYSDYGVNLGQAAFRMGFGGELTDPTQPPGNGVGNDSPVLSHYYARSYDPTSGTWQQPDPNAGQIQRPETLPSYQFVAENPSSNTDLLGYLSVGVANSPCCLAISSAPSYSGGLSVGNATSYPGSLNVGVSSGSWNGGSLQGGVGAGYLQPTYSPQRTADGRYLQNTYNPFSGYGWRSPGAYGQLFSTTNVLGAALQGSEAASSAGGTGIPLTAGGRLASTGRSSLLTGLPWPSGSLQGSLLLIQGSGSLTSGRIALPCDPDCKVTDTTGLKSSLAYSLWDHYLWNGGSTAYIDWSVFSSNPGFVEKAGSLGSRPGTQDIYRPAYTSDLYYAIGTATITRISESCYSVSDHYDFNPFDNLTSLNPAHHIKNVLHAGYWTYQLGGAREFYTYSQGCL